MSFILMATKTSINGNIGYDGASVGITNLDWQTGVSLTNYTPMFVVLKWRSGTSGGAFRIKVGAAYYLLNTTTISVADILDLVAPLSGHVLKGDFMTLEMTTASGTSFLFDVQIWGTKTN